MLPHHHMRLLRQAASLILLQKLRITWRTWRGETFLLVLTAPVQGPDYCTTCWVVQRQEGLFTFEASGYAAKHQPPPALQLEVLFLPIFFYCTRSFSAALPWVFRDCDHRVGLLESATGQNCPISLLLNYVDINGIGRRLALSSHPCSGPQPNDSWPGTTACPSFKALLSKPGPDFCIWQAPRQIT